MKKGFTLVELSIVLVIIGLLIGGILVGQSLIETARTSNTIRELQQFDIAAAQFREKYRNLPGDTNKFTTAGDGNGLIESTGGGGSSFNGELLNYWKHLSDTGFTYDNTSFSNTPTGEVAEGFHVPLISFGERDGGIIAYSYNNQNTYLYGGMPAGNILTFNFTHFTNALKVLPIDKKLDDGLPNTGIMTVGGGSCTSGSNYITTSSTAINCSFRIKMLSQME